MQSLKYIRSQLHSPFDFSQPIDYAEMVFVINHFSLSFSIKLHFYVCPNQNQMITSCRKKLGFVIPKNESYTGKLGAYKVKSFLFFLQEEFHKGLLTKDADEKNNNPSTRHFSHGCHLIQGEMNHGMEDYIFAQHRKLNGYDLGLYAIFDGHAGHDVAKYLQSHLFENILSEVHALVIGIFKPTPLSFPLII